VQHPPHFDGGAIPQFVTFRLAGTVPQAKLASWKRLLEQGRITNDELRNRVEAYLDAGHGDCWLNDPRIAELVQDALRFFDGPRYRLHGWVVMPNHVHALFTPLTGYSVASVVGSWKSFTSKRANTFLDRDGQFWQDDHFDRFLRNLDQFESTLWYIAHSPVAARLCARPEDWPYSHAGQR
jgi:REP element-mobilizing transposase RayT